jgi:hypothetical protein
MNNASTTSRFWDTDDLRLLGLSRIARCSACPRFTALKGAYDNGLPLGTLPPAPDGCNYEVCAPMVTRFASRELQKQSSAPRGIWS